jgi:hypothetical protein
VLHLQSLYQSLIKKQIVMLNKTQSHKKNSGSIQLFYDSHSYFKLSSSREKEQIHGQNSGPTPTVTRY